MTIYLGTAGAAAIVAGLAGIILVFVIGSSSPRLRNFRDAAGKPLRRTWTTIIAEPFAGTLRLHPRQTIVTSLAQWRDSIAGCDDAGLRDQVRDLESVSRMPHSVMLTAVAELD
ncbi:MAG: hypothetical protein ACRDSR_18840 [Pseudonocardiaceae bacterium]